MEERDSLLLRTSDVYSMLRKVNRDVLLWAILFWGAVTLIVIAPLAGWTYLKLTGGGVNLFRDIHEVD